MGATKEAFGDRFFYNEVNRFSGSGGEIIIKSEENKDSSPTMMDVGDTLIGIGITHIVESMSRTPNLNSFYVASPADSPAKFAMRAFLVNEKIKSDDGYEFHFKPLLPDEYVRAIEVASEGAVTIDVTTIPHGTIIMSFVDRRPTYTLEKMDSSPSNNWLEVVKAERHWHVGFDDADDFWSAKFPTDDVAPLKMMPSWQKVGDIRFGLSLLNKAEENIQLEKLPISQFSGKQTFHDFCLNGYATGLSGINSAFPIGLRTEIIFKPIR